MITPVYLERPAGYVTIRCASQLATADEADKLAQHFRESTGRAVGLLHVTNRLNRQPYCVIAKARPAR
jgi:hypothetical protein